jgi:hypothetical protein
MKKIIESETESKTKRLMRRMEMASHSERNRIAAQLERMFLRMRNLRMKG